MSNWLRLTATCEAPNYECEYGEMFRTWQQAKKAGRKHAKETGHLVRVEHIRTELFGWEEVHPR